MDSWEFEIYDYHLKFEMYCESKIGEVGKKRRQQSKSRKIMLALLTN